MTFGNFGQTGCPSPPPPASTGAVCGTSSYCDFPIFYWVDTGGNGSTFTITYTYTFNGSTYSGSAGLTFSVTGPTGSILPNTFVQTDDSATTVLNAQGNPAALEMTNAPPDPNVTSNPNVGIRFDDLATLPQGSLIWVQIIQSATYNQIYPTNSSYTPPPNVGAAALDGVYPYPSASNNTTNDQPARFDLLGGLGEAAESLDARMYVLWDPAIPPAGKTCTTATTTYDPVQKKYVSSPSTCTSIPVPLGSVEWKWSACAINQLGPAGTATPSWIKHCGPGFTYPATANGYPTWTACTTSEFGKC